MITLDGIEYNIASPDENASDIATQINDYCNENKVVNSDGDIIQVDINQANPLYVMIQGFGYLVSRLQQLIYSAGCALSIPSSSERQLLNIADMAGIRRKQPTKTSIIATVMANLDTDYDPVPCKITPSLKMSILTASGTVVFRPAFDVEIPIDGARTVILIADTYGSFNIEPNEDASFDVNPVGFRKMLTKASIPGQARESIASLRQRIQKRTEEGTTVDHAATAISQLDGVSLCNIYFNKSARDDAQLMGITVPPRQALVLVQGYSDHIAETFYANMLCECAGKDYDGAILQTYTTRSGQSMVVPIIPPMMIEVLIHVYFNREIDDITADNVSDVVCEMSQNLTIGETLTSAAVVDAILSKYEGYAIAGVMMQPDKETALDYQIVPEVYQIIVINPGNVLIHSR